MIHLDLQPEVEAELAAQALSHGLPIDATSRTWSPTTPRKKVFAEGWKTSLQGEPTPLTRSSPNSTNAMAYKISFAREASRG